MIVHMGVSCMDKTSEQRPALMVSLLGLGNRGSNEVSSGHQKESHSLTALLTHHFMMFLAAAEPTRGASRFMRLALISTHFRCSMICRKLTVGGTALALPTALLASLMYVISISKCCNKGLLQHKVRDTDCKLT